ncbi:hypothetical protein [Hydrogenivirga sp. 128-5-R1-1]|uniref:hypothetical protein n=1 Tax=Hydrogenivirga sp. 128-5-R1-1 TaxID=392423 RepID=UPI00015EF0FE|nr:hypothetical protein [Hydrogenivirga sp. 128-5-R1-1]EDP74695.1 hypothetical protein HG1285_14824 [Hydrogenivirga sp. 128-5-R1-1]
MGKTKKVAVPIPREEYEALKRLSTEMGLSLTKVLVASIRLIKQKFEEDPEQTGFELFKALSGKAGMRNKVGKEIEETIAEEKSTTEKKELTEAEEATQVAKAISERATKDETQERTSMVEMERERGGQVGKEGGEKPNPDEIYEMFLKRLRGGT